MDVGSNKTILFCYFLKTADVHVLTDDGDLGRQSLFYSQSLIFCPLFSHEAVHISCRRSQCLSSYICYVCLELSVLSNEVCLSIYFYYYSSLLISGHCGINDTLSCNTSSLLSCTCKSFFS